MTPSRAAGKVVDKMYESYQDCTCKQCLAPVIAKLIHADRRAERAAVRLVVRKLRKKEWEMRLHHSVWTDGYAQACDDLLAQLKARR